MWLKHLLNTLNIELNQKQFENPRGKTPCNKGKNQAMCSQKVKH